MKKNPPEFTFLKDEPRKSTEVSYKGFYHSSVVPALKKILKDKTSPHTIGLFGAWGTGKSTIIEMVQNDKELGLPVFVFDAWKYQEDTLRRTFLIKLVDFLRNEGYKLPDDILVNLYSSKTLSVAKQQRTKTETMSRSKKVWSWIKHYSPFIITILLLVAASILVTLYPNNVASKVILQLTSIAAGISFLALFGKPIIEGVLKVIVESFFAKQEQQTELITEVHQEDRLNSPEQFENKFIEVLGYVDKKLVIVFDNIDRVQGDVAISMLSTIKTFMYSNAKSGLVFLVPCDPTAIEVQVEKYFHGSGHKTNDSFGAAEYLRKIFNLIIWIPDFINTDLEEYTKSLLNETGEIGKMLNDEDVRLVINAAFSRNPREIIQFINNLIAMALGTQNTSVSHIINDNMAYLAKVLVIRQKFPKAYEALKESWNNPESITNGDIESPDFSNFMKKTSRITVDDAEPFIYFKDPADSRGLKRANDIKNALVSASVTEAVEASTNEPHDKLIDFITDLVGKYTGQENVLFNVVNAQFEVIAGLGINIDDSKRYINDLARAIDAELWPKYEDLALPHVFMILTKKKLNSSLRGNIVTRYIAALNTEGAITPLQRSIITSFKDNPSVLGKQQIIDVRSVLESKYGVDEETLSIFNTTVDQEFFITEKLINEYIASFDFDNLATKLATISNFRDYVLKHSLIPDIVEAVSKLLKQDTAADARYNSNKAKIIEAIESLAKIFGKDLENGSSHLSEIVANIIKVIPYTSQWEERADQTIALFWIRNYVSDADKQPVIDAINSYFQSFNDLVHFQKPIDYWNEESAGRFIKLILPTILPRLSTSVEVLRYVFEHAALDEKKVIIDDLIRRVPQNNYYDIDFINTIEKLPDRKLTISKLLNKAIGNSYNFKPKYFEFIASKIAKSDTVEIRTALDEIKTLITSNDNAQAEVGYSFLNKLSIIQDTDKRRLASELVIWLREPGRAISAENRLTFQVVNSFFSLLQDTPKNDYKYFLFSLLVESQSIQVVQIALDALRATHPDYKSHAKDFEDLLARMTGWSDSQIKQEIYNALPSLASGRQSKAEKGYWNSIKDLYPKE